MVERSRSLEPVRHRSLRKVVFTLKKVNCKKHWMLVTVKQWSNPDFLRTYLFTRWNARCVERTLWQPFQFFRALPRRSVDRNTEDCYAYVGSRAYFQTGWETVRVPKQNCCVKIITGKRQNINEVILIIIWILHSDTCDYNRMLVFDRLKPYL